MRIRLTLFGGLLSGMALACLFLSGEWISPQALWTPDSADFRILYELRLPRFLMALFVGGTLAVLGGTYQVLFQNALAEPYLLGVASAVTLGAAAAEFYLGAGASGGVGLLIGFIVAMSVTSVLVLLSFSPFARDSNRLVLFGMAVNFILSSILFLMVTYFYHGFGAGSLRWLFGQLLWVNSSELVLTLALGAPLLLILWSFGRSIDALSLGDSVARTLGVSPRKTRSTLLFVSSALIALLVSSTGAIGFVGLVTPHAARLLFRPATTRTLFIQAFLLGAVFLVVSDGLARALAPPLEFPVGVITTLVGGPLFLYVLWRRV